MLVSWNWLSDFVDLEGLDPSVVGDRLTLAGLELEGLTRLGDSFRDVVVAEVKSLEPHPDADKLRVCQVDDGRGELQQVVCGAPNVAAGMKVPFARPGAVLPGGLEINKARLRGVDSFGMLCSADELGLMSDVDGLLALPEDSDLGAPVGVLLGLDDVVLEIALTPNRPDCLSIRGVAREISALFGVPFTPTPENPAEGVIEGDEAIEEVISIEIEDGARCPRYAAAVIRDVTVGPSPFRMQARLLAVGQRPINNLVDLTNYLNLGYGQPLHAFDLADLSGAMIRVRDARPGETIETLDGKVHTLEGGELLICDAEKPVALAGVMGGANSDIEADRCDVLIECANFSPEAIRPTSRRLRIHTDASHRFERGVDSALVPEVLELAVREVFATAPKGSSPRRVRGILDRCERPRRTWTVRMPTEMPTKILGAEYTAAESIDTLKALGLGVERDGDVLVVSVDERRPDLTRPIDIVEEVGRVVGFERMPATFPVGAIGYEHERRDDAPVEQRVQPIVSDYRLQANKKIRQTCADAGIYEAVTWSLVASGDVRRITGEEPALSPNNALSSEADALRNSLLPGLLRSVCHNRSRQHRRVALFELGTCFVSADLERDDRERQHLGAVLAGPRTEAWYGDSEAFDVHDAVGVVDQLGDLMHRPFRYEPAQARQPWMHPNASVQLVANGHVVGYAAELHPAVLADLEIDGRAAAFELCVDAWLEVPERVRAFTGLAKTFGSTRDVALLVDRSLPFSSIDAALRAIDEPLLAEHRLFDVYTGSGVAEDKKSLAMSLVYRQPDPQKKLKDKHVEQAHSRVIDYLRETFHATTR